LDLTQRGARHAQPAQRHGGGGLAREDGIAHQEQVGRQAWAQGAQQAGLREAAHPAQPAAGEALEGDRSARKHQPRRVAQPGQSHFSRLQHLPGPFIFARGVGVAVSFVQMPPTGQVGVGAERQRALAGGGTSGIPGRAERGEHAVARAQRAARHHLVVQREVFGQDRAVQTDVEHKRAPAAGFSGEAARQAGRPIQQAGGIPGRQVGDDQIGGEGFTAFGFHRAGTAVLAANTGYLPAVEHAPAVPAHRGCQGFGDGAHAAVKVGHPAAGQIECGGGVERVGLMAEGLGRDQ